MVSELIGIFRAVMVYKGDSYGLNNCLTHTKIEPMVDIYDSRYPHTEHGQFVSRYYASTLLAHRYGGLQLYGNEVSWRLSPIEMGDLKGFILNAIQCRWA